MLFLLEGKSKFFVCLQQFIAKKEALSFEFLFFLAFLKEIFYFKTTFKKCNCSNTFNKETKKKKKKGFKMFIYKLKKCRSVPFFPKEKKGTDLVFSFFHLWKRMVKEKNIVFLLLFKLILLLNLTLLFPTEYTILIFFF